MRIISSRSSMPDLLQLPHRPRVLPYQEVYYKVELEIRLNMVRFDVRNITRKDLK